ncbi:hypothetical protein EU546_03965 [Candidatus Thorarchaeota archaeon]|nr:MAG: hypothetical protein EU546_03965 [Candidatus Thorarchaeota archaeon]
MVNMLNHPGLIGPCLVGIGGVVTILPILGFFQLLAEGRLTWPYGEMLTGVLVYVGAFVFLGFVLLGVGIEVIL